MCSPSAKEVEAARPVCPPPQQPSSVLPAWVMAGLALAALPGVIFPADTPWVNDEPALIAAALQANAARALAVHGLPGNMGVHYGPTATWIYQGLLLVTRDAVTLVLLHSLLLAAGTVAALAWLARGTRLWAPFAVFVALAPWVWFYDRQLWDNTFNIPICGLAFAAYAHFLDRRAPWALAVAVAGMAVAPFVHLMAVAFVAPLALHLLVLERRALLRHALVVLPFPLLFVLAAAPYLRLLLGALGGARATHDALTLDGFLFPLAGGRYLSALHFDWFPPDWYASPFVAAARLVTGAAYPLVWAGMALAVGAATRVMTRRAEGTVDHLAAIALGMVLAQGALDGLTGSSIHTHYFNATWIAYAFLAWLAADRVARASSRWLRPLAWLVSLHGASVAVVAVAVTAWTHAHSGPTIANQQAVARELARYPADTPVVVEEPHFLAFPHALEALRRLEPEPGAASARATRLVVRRAADPQRPRVEVVAE